MKIALINGSPKSKDSASGCILEELKAFLDNGSNTVSEFHFMKQQLTAEDMELLAEHQVLVFAFPLYVDGIPSHLLHCLLQLEAFFAAKKKKEIMVYSLVNSGFYEGHQNRIAIEMMENWSIKSGLKWGQGVAVGAGGMLIGLKNVPVGRGPKKNLGKALTQLSYNILKCHQDENLFITANFPRILYKLAAEMGWRQAVKENGLKREDLFIKK